MLFALIISGCGSQSTPTNTGDSQVPTTQPTATEATNQPGTPTADPSDAATQPTWDIVLSADLSAGSAESGEAIRRGAQLAINEINAAGGVLKRPLKLTLMDHRGNPTRAVDQISDITKNEQNTTVAILGGLHSPAAIAQVPVVHQLKMPFLIPWAAATKIVDNGNEPNFVFRVSVRDQFAGQVLTHHARGRNLHKPAYLLEQTAWGRSNYQALTQATSDSEWEAPVEYFSFGNKLFQQPLESLLNSGADHIIIVCNPREGMGIVNQLAEFPAETRLPVISHWGITGAGARFYTETKQSLNSGVNLSFLQSFSFFAAAKVERSKEFITAYCAAFCPENQPPSAACIFSPVGTAHAYELAHVLAMAMTQAQSADGEAVRNALEQLPRYEGLIKDYNPIFTPERHDALLGDDYLMCTYSEGGVIMPWVYNE